jgi:hypothetical protein
LGAVETPAVMHRIEQPNQAPGLFKITQAVSINDTAKRRFRNAEAPFLDVRQLPANFRKALYGTG